MDELLVIALDEVSKLSVEERIRLRYDKFRAMGSVQEIVAQRKRV
jgi:hypothetical protein